MAGKFLQAAYQVLDREKKPLDADEIVRIATELKILKTVGKTPGHTMRARLSDEIRQHGANSKFQRSGPNRFTLRDWGRFPEYHAQPFRKGVPNEVVACLPGTIQDEFGANTFGLAPISDEFLDYLANPEHLTFLDRRTAETTSKYKQIVAYVWLETSDGLVLTYTRGKYSSAHPTLLLGKTSVGFGGHVLAEDALGTTDSFDAFYIEKAAYREVGEELKGILPVSLETVGVIWDDSSYEGQKHVGIVLRGRLPSALDVTFKSTELSINTVQLQQVAEVWNSYHSMEFWSQLLLREFGSEDQPESRATIVPNKRPRDVSTIALVGEIASGKSTLCSALEERCSYEVVSASDCLKEILNLSMDSEHRRLDFQEQALTFINSTGGPAELANKIFERTNESEGRRVIVDGLRQLTTLLELKKLIPGLVVIYIECPRDVAYSNYKSRWSGATILNFAAVREHPVEADLPNFRYQADAILHNADSIEKVVDELTLWLE